MKPFVDLEFSSLNRSSDDDDGDVFAESVEAAPLLAFQAAYTGIMSFSRL